MSEEAQKEVKVEGGVEQDEKEKSDNIGSPSRKPKAHKKDPVGLL